MAVFIDIPGVGNIEAKNAATEATLLRILNAMNRVANNTSGRGGSGGSGGGSGSGSQQQSAGSAAAQSFGRVLGTTAKTVLNFASSITNATNSLANLDDSLSSAANTMNMIPVVGGVLAGVFGAIAGAVEKTSSAFQEATSSGATFAGSVSKFAGAASAAGMTMKDYAQLIKENSSALQLLGGNTDAGSKRFAAMTKTLRTTSRDLYALGYSTADVNKGLASYTKIVMSGGRNQNITNAELVAGSKRYLKELDLMAKVTGEDRKEKEKQMEKLATDAQFQASIAGIKDDKVRESFANTVIGLKGPLQGVAKDIISTGSATTQESRRFQSMMPESAGIMVEMAQARDRGEAISDAMRERLNNAMRREGKAGLETYRDQLRFTREFDDIGAIFISAAEIGENALSSSKAAQNATIKGSDGQVAAMEAMKQQLAELSNDINMKLAANMGALTQMMGLLQKMVDFIIPIFTNYIVPAVVFMADVILQVVIPAIEWLVKGLIKAAGVVMGYLSPVFTFLSKVIKEYVLPAMLHVKHFLEDHWMPILAAVAGILAVKFIPIMARTVLSMLAYMAQHVAMALPMIKLIAVIALAVAAYKFVNTQLKKMGFSYDLIADGAKWLWSYLYEFGQNLTLLYYILRDKFSTGDEWKEKITEQELAIKETQTSRTELENKMAKDKAENARKAKEDEQKRDKEKEDELKALKEGKYGEAFNLPNLNMPDFKMPEFKGFGNAPGGVSTKWGTGPGSQGPAGAEGAAGPVDLGSMTPEAVAAYAYKQQYGASTASGEAAKKEIISKAMKDAEDKAKAEADKTKAQEDAKKPVKPQETPETLLASLNTKMDTLIQINRGVRDLNDRQLSVQRGLGQDVFKYPGGA